MQSKKDMSRREAVGEAAKLAFAGTLGVCSMLILAGCGSNGASSKSVTGNSALTDEQTKALALNTANRKAQEALISEIEPHLQLNADGTIALNEQSTRATGLSDDAMKFAEVALSQTNAMVKAGKARVDDKFIVHSTDISRSNQNGWQWHWWGFTWTLNNERTGILADFLISLDYKDAMHVLSVYSGGTLGAATGGFLEALVPIMFAWGWTFKYVDWRGGNGGIIINATWSTLIWAYPQS